MLTVPTVTGGGPKGRRDRAGHKAMPWAYVTSPGPLCAPHIRAGVGEERDDVVQEPRVCSLPSDALQASCAPHISWGHPVPGDTGQWGWEYRRVAVGARGDWAVLPCTLGITPCPSGCRARWWEQVIVGYSSFSPGAAHGTCSCTPVAVALCLGKRGDSSVHPQGVAVPCPAGPGQ